MAPSGGNRLDTDVSAPGTSQLIPDVEVEEPATGSAETTDATGVAVSAESDTETDSAPQGQDR